MHPAFWQAQELSQPTKELSSNLQHGNTYAPYPRRDLLAQHLLDQLPEFAEPSRGVLRPSLVPPWHPKAGSPFCDVV